MYGATILELRKKHRMSQKDLGDSLGIGVSTISMWESEKREPSLDHVKAMVDLFGVPADYLLFGQFDDGRKLTKQDEELLDLFDQLPEEKKHEVRGIMKGILLGEK